MITDIIERFIFEPIDVITFTKIKEEIKLFYPGDSDVVVRHMPAGIRVFMEFKSPEDATFYTLKYKWT